MMRSASRLAFSSAFSRRMESSILIFADSFRFSSASRSFLCASSLSRSRAWRTDSSFSIVASKLALSVPTRPFASAIISAGTPRRSEMAKAFDLPGIPTSRR